MKRLTNLEPAEVSAVKRGANKRKFMVFKSTEKMSRDEMLKSIMGADPKIMAKVEKVLKSMADEPSEQGEGTLSPRAQTALKAVVRILLPFKDEISDEALDTVLTEAGFRFNDEHENAGEQMSEAGKKEGGMMGIPAKADGVSAEHHSAAVGEAEKAYKAHIGKLGYPAAEPKMKSAGQEGEMEASGEKDDLQGKAEKSAVGKSAETDLSKLPKEVQAIYKSNISLVQKVGEVEKQLKEERTERRRKEFIAKASTYKHYTGDRAELAEHMMELSDVSPKLFEAFEKNLEAVESQKVAISKSTFSEIGSSLASQGTTWEKIEQSAMGWVQKSGEKVTKEEAVAKFLGTPEGQKLYNEHQTQRPGGI